MCNHRREVYNSENSIVLDSPLLLMTDGLEYIYIYIIRVYDRMRYKLGRCVYLHALGENNINNKNTRQSQNIYTHEILLYYCYYDIPIPIYIYIYIYTDFDRRDHAPVMYVRIILYGCVYSVFHRPLHTPFLSDF